MGLRKQAARISVEIWDTGLGISDAEQHRIFDEFHQVNKPRKDRLQGIGLGLFIVQRTVRLLGLELSLTSRLGKGSKFSIGFRHVPEPIPPP